MSLINLLFPFLMSFASAQEMSLWDRMKPPVDISTTGYLIDDLFALTTWLIIFFFVFVCLGIFGFSYLYRKNKHPKPLYVHGTSKKHLGIVAGIGALVFIVVDMQITTISNRDYINVFLNYPEETEEVVRVQVLGQQWAWNFRYPGKDNIFNTEDDIVTLNDLRLPANKKVIFQITSKDVIHALYFPNARMKVDAMPGRISRMWYELKTPGIYDIACAEICGTFHYRMKAKLTVYSETDYLAWQNEMQLRVPQITEKERSDIYWGWKWITASK